jgi:hypothetical protein
MAGQRRKVEECFKISRLLSGSQLQFSHFGCSIELLGKLALQKKTLLVCLTILAAAILLACSQLTLFVIQPIGSIPEGRTLVISRMNKTNFIDSADALCERTQGGVSLLCRGAMLGAIVNKAKIYARLPYSEYLYLKSTGGKSYDR